ncbi:MAG: phosphoribosylformylglycinamidine synthase I [Epsilonproteobacteria bacterium]|nr:phosphoribosylformylglycinamidine synthase I [Campylobacterota bacterium]
MKVGVIVFPGTNCEIDTKYAYEKLGAEVELIWHKDTVLPKGLDLLVLPGGFSYGDYLRSGAIAKFSPVSDAVVEFAKKGGYILGICNGFQILLELSLLPGAMKKNQDIHFISEYHYLKVVNNDNKFLRLFDKGDLVNIPIAHGEGNYYIDDEGFSRLRDNSQILLTYCDKDAKELNPNGSVGAIAGICNKDKNVFGLMPHPERAVEEMLGSKDGVKMLEGFFK